MATRTIPPSTPPPPTPTPIATGKGSHAAAVNDGDLTKFLEKSLKVPDLTLPRPFPCSLHLLHRRLPTIDLRAVREGDEASGMHLVAAATGIGAFRVELHGVAVEEVRGVVELGKRSGIRGMVFGEEGRWVGKREIGVKEEICWSGPMGVDPNKDAPVTDAYRILREKLENLSMKLDAISQTVSNTISKYIRNPSTTKGKLATQSGYMLRIKKHDPQRRSSSVESTKTEDYPVHALTLHMSLESHEFLIRSQQGNTSYHVPSGSLVVTVGQQLQDWSNGELKGVLGEPIFDPHFDPNPSFSLEFTWSPTVTHRKHAPTPNSITIKDQLFILLVLVFFFGYRACYSFLSTKA